MPWLLAAAVRWQWEQTAGWESERYSLYPSVYGYDSGCSQESFQTFVPECQNLSWLSEVVEVQSC